MNNMNIGSSSQIQGGFSGQTSPPREFTLTERMLEIQGRVAELEKALTLTNDRLDHLVARLAAIVGDHGFDSNTDSASRAVLT